MFVLVLYEFCSDRTLSTVSEHTSLLDSVRRRMVLFGVLSLLIVVLGFYFRTGLSSSVFPISSEKTKSSFDVHLPANSIRLLPSTPIFILLYSYFSSPTPSVGLNSTSSVGLSLPLRFLFSRNVSLSRTSLLILCRCHPTGV